MVIDGHNRQEKRTKGKERKKKKREEHITTAHTP